MLTPEQVTELAYKEHLANQTEARRDDQEWLYHYYMGSQPELEEYLDDVLSKTYRSDDIEEMQKQYVNFTKKIMDQLSIVYDKPATRKLVFDKPEKKDIEKKIEEEWTAYYDKLLPENINTRDKKALAFGKLFSSSLTQVIPKKGKFGVDYKVDPNFLYAAHLDEDDPFSLDALFYQNYYKDLEGRQQMYVIVWTDGEYYKVDALGNKLPIGNNKRMDNPLKMIPVAKLILDEGLDFWGQGQFDVVNVNEQVNFLLTKLVSRDILYGSEGTTLTINCELLKKSSDDDDNGVRQVKTGLKHPVVVEGVRSDMTPPDIRHVTMNPLITEINLFIENYLKTIALSKGLDSNSFMAEVKATSGFSKMIDSLEQMEIRRKDIEPCRIYERERFEITRTVNNFMATTPEGKKLGYKEIPKDLVLKVDFSEIDLFRTPEEEQADFEYKLKHGFTTEADELMQINPDIATKEEAEEIIKTNKALIETKSKLFNLPIRADAQTNDEDLSDVEENV